MTAAGTPTRTSSSGSTTSERKSYVELISGLTWRCTRSTAHADASRRSAPHNFRLYITRVLARETKDECDDLSIERVGRDVLGRRVGPVSANELPVPPHQRCGRNEEGGPTLARQESRERRQHDTIGRGEPRSRHLTTEHRELVTKDRDLDSFSSGVGPIPTRSSSFRTRSKVIEQLTRTILALSLRRWSEPRSYAFTPQDPADLGQARRGAARQWSCTAAGHWRGDRNSSWRRGPRSLTDRGRQQGAIAATTGSPRRIAQGHGS